LITNLKKEIEKETNIDALAGDITMGTELKDCCMDLV